MYHWKGYNYGSLRGTQYFFPDRGDGLPMHYHMVEDAHNVIVLKGSCEIYGPEKSWSYTATQGAIFHFQEQEYPHEIAALEAGTVLLNLTKYGDKFVHLKNWAEHDQGGVIEDPITIPLDSYKSQNKKRKS